MVDIVRTVPGVLGERMLGDTGTLLSMMAEGEQVEVTRAHPDAFFRLKHRRQCKVQLPLHTLVRTQTYLPRQVSTLTNTPGLVPV